MPGQSPLDIHDHRQWSMPLDGPRRVAFERFHNPSRWPSWMLDTVRAREQAGTPEHIDAIADIALPDQDESPVRLRDLWADGPAVIVWLRQFGCPFCRAYAVQLNRARGRFQEAGARLVLIGQGTPDDARRFRRHLGIDLQILTDIDRVTYLWAGTKLAALDELIGPRVVARGLLAMAQNRVLLGHNTADEAQLGGSIIVTPNRTIVFSHISRDASDMASPKVLLDALRGAAPRVREATASSRSSSHAPRAKAKVVVAAALTLMGSMVLRAPNANATSPAGLPQGDPGQPVFVTGAGAAPLPTDRTVAHWHGQFTDPFDGTSYGFNMVGADPALQQDVTIPVDIIPVDAVFTSQGNYRLSGSDIIPRLLASPIFSPTDFSSTPWVTGAMDTSGNVAVVPGGELSAGNTGVQFEDAIMRSQFNRVGTSYHVRLRPTVLSPWTVNCSRAGGAVFQNSRGVVYGYCNNYPFDAPWGQWNPDPTHLILFVGDNLIIGPIGGGALGWHAASRLQGYGTGRSNAQGNAPLQTWGYATYLRPGTYNPAFAPFESDVSVFAHELAEWADDPFDNNLIGAYDSPLPPQGGCGRLLEVGDPVDRVAFTVPGNAYDTGPYADGSWHSQDIVFLPWFARETPNVTSQATQSASPNGGRYTFMGDLNPYAAFHGPAAAC